MYLELIKVKMYLKQEIFIKLSKFFILGLERMKKPDPEETSKVVVEAKPSTATNKMTIKM